MDLVIENVGRRSETWSEAGSPTDVGDASLNGFERNVLFWNLGGGRFADVGYLAGADRIEDGRGVAVADFDRDGRLDVLVQNLDRAAMLLMGRGEAGHWLQVALDGEGANRDAIGAEVRLTAGGRTQTRQVRAGSGFLSASTGPLHFGLGDAATVEQLEVRWPSGRTTRLRDLAVDQRVQVRAGGASGDDVAVVPRR